MSHDEYWKRIERIPLIFERDTVDGEARMYRAQDGTPVRVTKPKADWTSDELELTVDYYESMYSPRR